MIDCIISKKCVLKDKSIEIPSLKDRVKNIEEK